MTPNGKAKDGIYRRGCFFWVFSVLMLQMKNENRYNGSYFYIPFSVFKLGKRKVKLDYPILIFHYGIGERKTKGRYIQHMVVFRLSCFHFAKEKAKMGITDHISIFRFCLRIRKKGKGCLVTVFLFSIVKKKNEKQKDGMYTDRVGVPIWHKTSDRFRVAKCVKEPMIMVRKAYHTIHYNYTFSCIYSSLPWLLPFPVGSIVRFVCPNSPCHVGIWLQ